MARGGHIYGKVGPINPATGQVMSQTYAQADKVNKHGTPAFSRSIEEQTLAVLTTQTLSNTFYASQKELAKDTVDVLRAMSAKDPVFLGKALVYARNKGLMKLAPTVGLAVLSENKTEAGQEAFRKAFRHVIRIPDDLREFVELIRTGSFGGKKSIMGLRKTMIQNWLRHMSEYHGLKYGSANSEGMTLRDILRLTHPRPKANDPVSGFYSTPMGPVRVDGVKKDRVAKEGRDYDRLRSGAQAEMFGWLVKGWEKIGDEPSPSNALIWAFEKVKRSEDEKEIVSLVKKYKLPWEVVVPSVKKMTKAVWLALMDGMPYMALLRNLNTFSRHGLFEDKAVVKEIAKKISEPEAVGKSKQFPFRFWNAFKAYNGPQEIRDALTDALEASFVNMPEIKGMKVLVSNDISSSMSSPVSDKSDTSISEIAGLFGAALFKKSEDVELIPFDDKAHPSLGKVSKRDTIMSITKQIAKTMGGTNLGAPIELLLREKRKVDVFIGITDNEDWAGRGFLTSWEEYRSKVSPKAKAFLVTVAPHRDFVAPSGYPDVHFIMGWGDSVLRYIPLVLGGGAGQVDDVKAIDFDTFGKKAKEEEVETPVEQ